MPKPKRSDPIGEVVAKNLRDIRINTGLQLDESSEMISRYLDQPVSASSLQQWETLRPPRRFTIHELYAICRAYRISLPALLLPDPRQPAPEVSGDPYIEVWNAFFLKLVVDVQSGRNQMERLYRSFDSDEPWYEPGSVQELIENMREDES
jgi:hypothetical protein